MNALIPDLGDFADGHVEESPATFDDKYLDPGFRAQRPRVVGVDGLDAS